ncbi:MAG: HU family DNA-binding protein [Gammaproteobacteria bacterium]|nr:HU family DNA-binding protein [Gammaproteobacteria bacterium]
MKKTEFIDAVAEAASISKTDASKAVEAMLTVVTNALKAGDQVAITGFGTFLMRTREARTGRNPRTGEALNIAAANIPSFKAGKGLKDAVN